MRSVIVLGAGMVGVSAALQLTKRGCSVALVDRRAPGQETSYGNAGIIQSEAVEPYAMPRDLRALLAIALGRSNDVHYELRALPSQASALLRYWWHSAPKRHARISKAYAQLIAQATAEHAAFIAEAGADDIVKRQGFRFLYRTEQALSKALSEAERLRAVYGVAVDAMEPAALTAAEPALRHGGAGALHFRDPWTVSDPGALAARYADLFTRLGGTVISGDASSLEQRPGGGWQVATADGPLEAETVVAALGPWSPVLVRRFGYRVPMVRKRGYHRHYRAPQPLELPLMDAQDGYVMAPMAKGLRITTGAELAVQEARGLPVQLRHAEAAAGDLLDLGAPVENAAWSGTRPCMPDMLPVVGKAPRHQGLWFDFGHGHQGLTLGPATGRLLAELMLGETPYVDAKPLSPARIA